MHTTQMSSGVSFVHNGDYSGQIIINAPDSDNPNVNGRVIVPFNDLKKLIADYARRFKEDASDDEVLGISTE